MENLNKVDERRRYRRIDSALSVRYRNLRKNENPTIESLSKNIGEGGVCFNSGEFISLACRMIVEITLPTTPKPIKAISKVAWIRKIPAGDSYQIGNQFLEITKDDRDRISQFINQVVKLNT
jgi:c-di-GMP-binding flagellar brake protein YcgR